MRPASAIPLAFARICLVPAHAQEFAQLPSFKQFDGIAEAPQTTGDMGAASGLQTHRLESRAPEAGELVSQRFSPALADALVQDSTRIIDYANARRFDPDIDTGPKALLLHFSLRSKAEAPLHNYGLAHSPKAACGVEASKMTIAGLDTCFERASMRRMPSSALISIVEMGLRRRVEVIAGQANAKGSKVPL